MDKSGQPDRPPAVRRPDMQASKWPNKLRPPFVRHAMTCSRMMWPCMRRQIIPPEGAMRKAVDALTPSVARPDALCCNLRAPGTAHRSLQDMDNVSLAHLATILPRRTRQPLNSSNTITAMVESQKRRMTRSQSKGRPSIIDFRRSSRPVPQVSSKGSVLQPSIGLPRHRPSVQA